MSVRDPIGIIIIFPINPNVTKFNRLVMIRAKTADSKLIHKMKREKIL